jgi:hypothetical protein
MSNLKSVSQTYLEIKRYTVSYDSWLDDTEELFDHSIVISPVTTPPLTASDAFTSNSDREISFFLKGGVTGTIYDVKLLATTTVGQLKEDNMQMVVF